MAGDSHSSQLEEKFLVETARKAMHIILILNKL